MCVCLCVGIYVYKYPGPFCGRQDLCVHLKLYEVSMDLGVLCVMCVHVSVCVCVHAAHTYIHTYNQLFHAYLRTEGLCKFALLRAQKASLLDREKKPKFQVTLCSF